MTLRNPLLPLASLIEPIGFKTLSWHPFDFVEGDGWTVAYGDQWLDASGGSLIATWWKGLKWGNGPYNLQLRHAPVSSYYTAFRFWSAVKPPNPILKLGFFQGTAKVGSNGAHPVSFLQYPRGHGLGIHMEGGPLTSLYHLTGGPNVIDGLPHVAEYLWVPNKGGMLLTVKCDGKLIGPPTQTQSPGKFYGYNLNPNCAGGLKPWASNQTLQLDWWYASGI